MKCSQCQADHRPQAKFCEECGASLARDCASCGAGLSATAKFCAECGKPAVAPASSQTSHAAPETYIPKHLAERIIVSKAALEGARKHITVLFADLKGSTELLVARDPEEARRLLDPVLEIMIGAVHRYEGTVNQVMGDGIMALFGAPIAHEDHAVRACYAALRMQDEVGRYSGTVKDRAGALIQIRVGLNSGEVVVRSIGSDLHMDYTAVGETTHLAARMEQLARPGGILLTARTTRLAEGHVDVKPVGAVMVKGFGAPVEAYELTGAQLARTRIHAAQSRGLTRFVGREAELAQVRRILDKARGGQGQVVAVVGEPGVGKSRLFWELARTAQAEGWALLESGSVSHGKATPYLPIIMLLRAYFAIHEGESEERVATRVAERVRDIDAGLVPMVPAFLTLLEVPTNPAWQSLTAHQRRQRTLNALRQLLVLEGRARPTLIRFEDLHWIDSETQAVLDSVVDSLPGTRAVLLVNYRPEYQHGWGGKSYYSQLRLEPFATPSAHEFLDALLGADPSLLSLRRLLLEQTDGNPLFFEEMVRTLAEVGAMSGQPGAYSLARPVETLSVPPTVQDVLAARIDRLAPEDKRLLQTAAVIGKDVPFRVLERIVDASEADLVAGLARLQAGEFLYETRLYPAPEYTFKHALTQEVADAELLQDRRRSLHRAVLHALESLAGAGTDVAVGRLAHHAVRAEDSEQAVRYLVLSADKALRGYALTDAEWSLEEAMNQVSRLPGDPAIAKARIIVRLAFVRLLLGQLPASCQLLLDHQDVLDRLDDTALRGLYHCRLGYAAALMGDSELAVRHARAAVEDGERAGDRATQGIAHFVLSLEGLWTAPATVGIAGARRATELLEGTTEQVWLGMASWCLGFNQATIGDLDAALVSLARARAIGERIEDPRVLAYADFAASYVYTLRGEAEPAVEMATRAVTGAPDPIARALAAGFLGYAYALAGALEDAIAHLEQARMLAFFRHQSCGIFLGILGEAHARRGDVERAQAVADEALEEGKRARAPWTGGWIMYWIGRTHRTMGRMSDADRSLHDALDRFAASGTGPLLSAFVHTELAAVAAAGGQGAQAIEHAQIARRIFQEFRLPRRVAEVDELARRLSFSVADG